MRRPPAAVRRVRAGDLSPRHSRRVRGDFRAVRGERVRRRPRPPGPRRGVRIRRGARIPRMPWQGAGENNRAQRNRESVFPSARPHSAGSGECDALAASAVGGGFGAANDIAAVRRSGAGDIFRYQLLAKNIRARCAVRLPPSGGFGRMRRAGRVRGRRRYPPPRLALRACPPRINTNNPGRPPKRI